MRILSSQFFSFKDTLNAPKLWIFLVDWRPLAIYSLMSALIFILRNFLKTWINQALLKSYQLLTRGCRSHVWGRFASLWIHDRILRFYRKVVSKNGLALKILARFSLIYLFVNLGESSWFSKYLSWTRYFLILELISLDNILVSLRLRFYCDIFWLFYALILV